MKMRDLLGYFAYKYNGNYGKILKAIEGNEYVSSKQIELMYKKLDYDFFTLIDDDYPEMLKRVDNPPIVMFYKGDISLINEENKIVGRQTEEGIRMIHSFKTNVTSEFIEIEHLVACECHDDMDGLVEWIEETQECVEELISMGDSKKMNKAYMC